MKKRGLTPLLLLVGIPLVILAGVLLWEDRQYNLISMAVAFLACLPFFAAYEKGRARTTEMILIAVLTALSVVGRVIFAPLPGFKPVTALTVITALHFGPQAGFLTGALTAVVSNIFFGQGPWTPFQMFVWGMIGYGAGLLQQRKLLDKKWMLALYGIVAGIAFSLMMDVWSVLTFEQGGWSWSRYLALIILALPFTVTYAVSNVVFLLTLTGPIGRKLERVKLKYGLEGARTDHELLTEQNSTLVTKSNMGEEVNSE